MITEQQIKENNESNWLSTRIKDLNLKVVNCSFIGGHYYISIQPSDNQIITGITMLVMSDLGYDLNSVTLRENKIQALFISKKEVE